MSLYRRRNSSHFWCRFRIKGLEVRLSTGTGNREQAKEFEDTARSAAWRQAKLGDKPPYPWTAARKRWLAETQKRTKTKDEAILAWFDEHLKDADVQGITLEVVDELRALKAEEASQATADRYMALLRAILRKCVHEWNTLESMPKVRMYRPEVAEPRFLTRAEFERLVKELPEHLKLAARFAVNTGLRMRSMLSLQWARIDLKTKRAWIPGIQMKAGRTLGIPLNSKAVKVLKDARALLQKQEAEHRSDCERDGKEYKPVSHGYVFTFRRQPFDDANGRAFKDAVKRAKLEPLRWHDLRHTFASWAVQNDVPLHELMQLGGWKSYKMVLNYAHLAPEHLAEAAERIATPRRIRAPRGGSRPTAARV
jgi:integrase